VYIVAVGAGKVGWNLARELIDRGNELTLVESDPQRYATVEEELEHAVQYGDGTELWVLERAGIERDVDLHSGVPARIEHLAGQDGFDQGHGDAYPTAEPRCFR